LSLRELFREFSLATRRVKDERQRDTSLAWHIASFAAMAFAGKLPSWSRVMGQEATPSQSQTPGQMRSTLAVLAQQYGYPLKRGGKVVVV
jgi:hypothetical protein